MHSSPGIGQMADASKSVQMEFDRDGKTIPDINTYNKPDSKPVDKTRNSSFAMGDFPDGKIPKAESVRKENKYTEDKTEILFSEIENLDSNTHIPEIKKRFELKKRNTRYDT